MRYWARLARWMQSLDFGFLLPTMARLPLWLGGAIAKIRGITLCILDYEWRSIALGRPFVRRNTYSALKIITPHANERKWVYGTLSRFVHNSREEWQAWLFDKRVMARIARNSRIEGLDDLLRVQARGRGLLMVSCHYDSFCMGMVLFGMNGLTTHVISTNMYEDPRIHPAVKRHFDHKYRAMERRMNGKMVYHQEDRRFFYRALERGELVTLMGDIPGSKSTLYIPFVGRRFKMPLGTWHMAKETGSAVGAFVCLYEAPGRYRVVCLPPKDIDPDSPLNTMMPIYAFLEAWIRKIPQRWINSDLLMSYVAPEAPARPGV